QHRAIFMIARRTTAGSTPRLTRRSERPLSFSRKRVPVSPGFSWPVHNPRAATENLFPVFTREPEFRSGRFYTPDKPRVRPTCRPVPADGNGPAPPFVTLGGRIH